MIEHATFLEPRSAVMTNDQYKGSFKYANSYMFIFVIGMHFIIKCICIPMSEKADEAIIFVEINLNKEVKIDEIDLKESSK